MLVYCMYVWCRVLWWWTVGRTHNCTERCNFGGKPANNFRLISFSLGWAILPLSCCLNVPSWPSVDAQWVDLIEKLRRAPSNWKSKFTALPPSVRKPLFVRQLPPTQPHSFCKCPPPAISSRRHTHTANAVWKDTSALWITLLHYLMTDAFWWRTSVVKIMKLWFDQRMLMLYDLLHLLTNCPHKPNTHVS